MKKLLFSLLIFTTASCFSAYASDNSKTCWQTCTTRGSRASRQLGPILRSQTELPDDDIIIEQQRLCGERCRRCAAFSTLSASSMGISFSAKNPCEWYSAIAACALTGGVALAWIVLPVTQAEIKEAQGKKEKKEKDE